MTVAAANALVLFLVEGQVKGKREIRLYDQDENPFKWYVSFVRLGSRDKE